MLCASYIFLSENISKRKSLNMNHRAVILQLQLLAYRLVSMERNQSAREDSKTPETRHSTIMLSFIGHSIASTLVHIDGKKKLGKLFYD